MILDQNNLSTRESTDGAVKRSLSSLPLKQALEAIPDAAALYDAGDRLIVANDSFLELNEAISQVLVENTSYETYLRAAASAGLFLDVRGRKDEWVTTRLRLHKQVSARYELTRADGSSLLVREQRLDDGCTLILVTDITECKVAEREGTSATYIDSLTGLPNRSLFCDRLRIACLLAERQGTAVAILVIDLDQFKRLNFALGHRRADDVLKQAAAQLCRPVRKSDTVARVGDDEFAVVLAPVKKPEDADILAERILGALSEPIGREQDLVYSGASMGVAVFPRDGADPEQLLKSGELALTRAKSEGRGRYAYYSRELSADAEMRWTLARDLRRALLGEEFEIRLQPKVSIDDRAVVGGEALLRWIRSAQDVVSPATFIPVAESTGLIIPIGELVIQKVCKLLRDWDTQRAGHLPIAVNVSAAQFRDPDLTRKIEVMLEVTGIDPELLELEVTESALMHDAATAVATLHRLAAVQRLKIDISFIRDIDVYAKHASIVEAIIRMGRSLGLRTLAEGVEKEAERRVLEDLGCDEMQGFLISPPIQASKYRDFVHNLEGVG
jgi:diguanylate cyclase (GGDEF)-like protein